MITQRIVYEHFCLIQIPVFFIITGLVGCDILDPAEQHSSVHCDNSDEPTLWQLNHCPAWSLFTFTQYLTHHQNLKLANGSSDGAPNTISLNALHFINITF